MAYTTVSALLLAFQNALVCVKPLGIEQVHAILWSTTFWHEFTRPREFSRALLAVRLQLIALHARTL